MVLAHGLPVVIEVTAESMTPSLHRGAKVKVEPVDGDLHAGDIVLIATGEGHDLLLHRVMHLFSEGGERFVIHQGDAPLSTFATCSREAVIGRVTGLSPQRAQLVPTLENLSPKARARFVRRRRVCAVFSLGRRLMLSLRLGDRKLTRRLARALRALALNVTR